ncbi:MAG: efflux RND transporter permease subunit, partial [Planctomycetota bacterium]
PDDARSPIVYRFDPSLDPILKVSLGGNLLIRDLRRLGEGWVKQRLETLPGVAALKVVGGAEEEVRIEVDESRLNALGIPIDEVVQRVREENVNRSGGELRDSETAYLVRTVNEFEDLQDVEATIIRDTGRGQVRLRDIGRAFFAQQDREVRVRVDGRPAVELHIYKEGDANAVQVARLVRERLDTVSKDRRLQGIRTTILFDQARYIEESVANVRSTALLGALLAALVLFLFLKDLLSTLIITLSIPISVAATFLLMRLSDISLNVMSLGGLALGIGMLVDNSVVVLESVNRRREEGLGVRQAVIQGTREVMGGVIASTLTTISVFLPLIFVEGIAGQIFHDQALVVTYSLLASLLVAIKLIPTVLASREVSMSRWPALLARGLTLPMVPVVALFQRGVTHLTTIYERVLRAIVQVPWSTPLVAAVLFVAVVPRVTDPGTELVPDLFQGEFYYDLELPEGTPIEATDAKVAQLEETILNIREAQGLAIADYHVTVGGAPVLGDLRAGDRRDHIARVNITMRPEATVAEEKRCIAALDEAFAGIPGCPVRLGRPTLFTFRDPIEVEVYATELEELRRSAEAVVERLRLLPGLVDVKSDVADRSPEIHVVLDPLKLAAFGLSHGEVARVLAVKGIGEVSGQYTQGEKPIDIRVLAAGARRGTLRDATQLAVSLPEQAAPILLSSVGTLKQGLGPVEVRHVSGERAALVTARIEGTDLGTASRDVERVLRGGRFLPPGTTAKLSGQNEEMRASLASLALALTLAVFLVYLVLASSFESLRLPFAILLTVPLGLIGAVGALWLSGLQVGVLAMIGVILLSGIVVNNGIIFIARIIQHRARGLSAEQACCSAGLERLRPILITSLTTILGLLPLAIGLGAGAELRRPLAITVIGGILVATFLTLTVVPSGYLLLGGRRAVERSTPGGEP